MKTITNTKTNSIIGNIENPIEITKSIKNNKSVFVFNIKKVGLIFIPPSTPEYLIPYLEYLKKRKKYEPL